jgi:hypothetical protein
MKLSLQLLVVLFGLLLLPALTVAQDPGEPDTVRVVYSETDPGIDVGVPITIYNDEDIGGYSLGFSWDSPDVSVDSVSYVGSRVPPANYTQNTIDNPSQLVLCGMIDFSSLSPLPTGDGLVFTIWFNVPGGTPDQFVFIDSSFVPPAGEFLLSLTTGASAHPQFIGNNIKIGDPQPPPIIDLSSTSYVFNAEVGGGNPNSQVLNIENAGGQDLEWNATWDQSWLLVNPTMGTAPSVVVLAADIGVLPADTYTDSIEISAAGATNSPQYVEVTLNLTVPPPTISLSPDSFYFQVLQDSANPDPQVMQIENIGQGTLNWTAVEAASWLTLDSYAGTAPSSVTLDVDNTGLGPNVYTTQIEISDPTADNSPQYAVVVFEVFSAFPVVNPEPDSIYAVGSASVDPYDRVLYIHNDGGGVMDWEVSEAEDWMSLSIDTGSAVQGDPSEVIVSFDGSPVFFGQHFADITVTSNNATNSPVVVPVTYWKAENPQTMTVSPSALSFQGVECGTYPGIAPQNFIITKSNSDPNLNWTASYMASWLEVSPTSGPGNAVVEVSIDDAGLAPGVYEDTIVVSSEVTLNQAKKVVVTLTIDPSPPAPDLGLSVDSAAFIFRWTLVGTAYQNIVVYAEGGGCLDWQAAANVPWVTPIPASGTTVETMTLQADAVGLSLGKHEGEVIFTSATAPNSPVNLPVTLWVYTLGDANGDGIVNITDVVYIIDYIFNGGPAPIPLPFVGDADCNHRTDISDAVYLIAWIFSGGPPPCAY